MFRFPWRRTIAFLLPTTVVLAAGVAGIYGTVQQSYRSDANDPQTAIARDAVTRLDGGTDPKVVAAGQPVDLASSLDTHITVYDTAGHSLASTATLNGTTPVIDKGVLDSARSTGQDIVTWEPSSGVRVAAVALPWSGGTVVVGRSLQLVEQREDKLFVLCAALGGAAFAVLIVVCSIAAWVWPRAGTPALP